MKIQRFKDFINENEEYLDEPATEMFSEILNQIASAIDGNAGWSVHVNEDNGTLHIDQDWNIYDLNYEGEEPRVWATYSVIFKLSFQDDTEQLSPELVRLWKLGLAPLNELIKGFDHIWSFSVDSKDVPALDIQEGNDEYEFISIEDLTGGTMNDLSDIDEFANEMVETLNGWIDEQTYMLYDRVQQELDEISGQYDEDEDGDDKDKEYDEDFSEDEN